MCVCVCVLNAKLRGAIFPTRIVKSDIFDIVGYQLGKSIIKNSKLCLSECKNANRFSVRGRFRG